MTLVYNGHGAPISEFLLSKCGKEDFKCRIVASMRPKVFLPLLMDLYQPYKTKCNIDIFGNIGLHDISYEKIVLKCKAGEINTIEMDLKVKDIVTENIDGYTSNDDNIALSFTTDILVNNNAHIKLREYTLTFLHGSILVNFSPYIENVDRISFTTYTRSGDHKTSVMDFNLIDNVLNPETLIAGYAVSNINQMFVDLNRYHGSFGHVIMCNK